MEARGGRICEGLRPTPPRRTPRASLPRHAERAGNAWGHNVNLGFCDAADVDAAWIDPKASESLEGSKKKKG